ncbi:Mu transposase C-terminal domain-containing protein [Xanthomonas campestris pv. campestris]|uniref:Mu transposase C-terminal domain-containing protein n=1 Tax=Xanthomonas campestris TaxID=339 RepID=UPI001E581AAF|nr:Mu transposase C-terminal domain-containing protein [Xanthomonas campestris]MCC5067104.1 DDE-type integrase/transposase/recombinase [Xanthomonas campestris]MEB2230942.1 Mu transposase C-terminal domain-containing protein [Xanthomonas campestris pv. campestris]
MSVNMRAARPARDLVVKPGELVMCGGKLSKIVSCVAPDKIHVKTEGSAEFRWVGIGELATYEHLERKRQIRHVSQSDSAQEAAARDWTRALGQAVKKQGTRLSTETCRQIATQFGVSTKTVRRRWRLHCDNPLPVSQLPSMPGPAPEARLLSPLVENLIAKAIDEVYLVREGSTVSAVVRRCTQLAREANTPAPSYAAVKARIKSRDPLQVAVKRKGSHEAYATQAPSIRGLDTSYPLEVVQIDHALVDLMVVSPLTRQVIGRPWITLAIDVFTRCVVGYYMSFDPPDQTSVALTLEHSCLPKEKWLHSVGLSGKLSYPMFGKMSRIAWDNAKTFKTKSLLAQCERYGIEVRPRPVRRPHYGAYIERYIGTMMGAVHLLPGTTFSNSKQRGDYPSEKKAVLTVTELEQWLAAEIAGVYHNKPHSGLGGQTPAQVWEHAWTSKHGVARFPPIVGNPRDFTLGFLPAAGRKIGRTGIQLHSLHYWDPALTPFINDGIEHRVHFSQRDLSKVYLYVGGDFIDVPLLDRSREPFSFWELRDIRTHLKDQGRKASSESELFDALELQRSILIGAANSSKKARRKVAKLPEPRQRQKQDDTVDYTTPVAAIPASLGEVE